MLKLTISSQSINNDSITINKKTFVSIIKASNYCDSLKIAFSKKSNLIDTLALSNTTMFNKLELNQKKRIGLNSEIETLNKTLRKKKDKSLIYGISGLSLGTLITFLIIR